MKTQGCLSKFQTPTRHCFHRVNIFLLCSLAIIAGCKQSNDEAKKVKRVEAQLDLPAASADQKKSADNQLDWEITTLVDAYDKVGSKNKKWDGPARDALKFYAKTRAYGTDIEGFPGVLSAYVSRAIELGCDDPLIKYLYVRFVLDGNRPQEQLAQAYSEAADGLQRSEYPPIRKLMANIGAAVMLSNIRPLPSSIQTYQDGATEALCGVLKDKNTPIAEVDDLGHEFLGMIKDWQDKKGRYDRVDELLIKNWSKSGVTFVLRGEFYFDYAWSGRSHKTADKVTKEQWKLFAERLAETEKIVNVGMEIAPKEGRLPSLMIRVAGGQNKGLPEMRNWWEKAMEADPNSFQACANLLNYLLPRWYGSREAMVAFGRECLNSEKFGGTVPLVLAEAHDKYNYYDGATDGSYWKQPDVWPDIRDSYEKFFKLNPNAHGWRHNYARYAYWCGQWEALQEQLKLMGDDINYDFFGGRAEFEKMVKLADSHTKDAKQ